MGLPMLNSFLGCCSVRTGVLVLGWISVVQSFFTILNVFFRGIAYLFLMQDAVEQYSSEMTESQKEGIIITKVLIIIICLVLIVKFAFDLMYLIGIYKKNRCLMLPTIIVLGLVTLLYVIISAIITVLTIGLCIVKLSNPAATTILGAAFLATFLGIITSVISVYTFLLVYTFYRMVGKEQKFPEVDESLKDCVNDNELTVSEKGKEFSKDCVKT